MQPPSHLPPPRSCKLLKWPDHFVGYGFNLHAEKGKHGQFIGKVDANSPGELAGLVTGHRIVAVNSVNVSNENHQQVVQRIKMSGDVVTLLTVDRETDDWCKSNKVFISETMPEFRVIHYSAPVKPPPGIPRLDGKPEPAVTVNGDERVVAVDHHQHVDQITVAPVPISEPQPEPASPQPQQPLEAPWYSGSGLEPPKETPPAAPPAAAQPQQPLEAPWYSSSGLEPPKETPPADPPAYTEPEPQAQADEPEYAVVMKNGRPARYQHDEPPQRQRPRVNGDDADAAGSEYAPPAPPTREHIDEPVYELAEPADPILENPQPVLVREEEMDYQISKSSTDGPIDVRHHEQQQQQYHNQQSQKPPSSAAVNDKKPISPVLNNNREQPNQLPQENGRAHPHPSATTAAAAGAANGSGNNSVDPTGLGLNMSAREMREMLKSRKKQDIRNSQKLSVKDKHRVIDNL